jgi:vanillate O-demethylase monooxygenase subunit
LDVVVTETTVALHREYPAAPLPEWQAGMLEVGADVEFRTFHDGFFLSPAVWVDHWDVRSDDGQTARMRFAHLVTPVGPRRSRVLWRVSRDFAPADTDAGSTLTSMFEPYYERVVAAMETAQAVLDLDGPGPEINVSSDVAALKVREIIASLIAEEAPLTLTTRIVAGV